MSEDEDLDLLALQRQLDDAFETTRPRRDFEDELWLRLQSRRPFWRRLQDGWAGLWDGVREAPAVPSAAVAALLILVVGAGVISLGGLNAIRSTGTATSRSQSASAPNAFAGGAFGRLPTPALHPERTADTGITPLPTTSSPDKTPVATLYLGPAVLSWKGQLPVAGTHAPVFRYAEPTAADADQFAATVQAVANPAAPPTGYLGSYAGRDFLVTVNATTQQPREPFFYLVSTASATPPGSVSATDVNAFLADHSLTPEWPNEVVTTQIADQARVLFLREFDIPAGGAAHLVDGFGERYGLEVDLKGGQPSMVSGPLPLKLDSTDYPLISAAQAENAALASSSLGTLTISPPPAVQLTTAELVYALAWGGDQSYYEPCFLFSGTFTYNGTTYMKRVLVPAVSQP